MKSALLRGREQLEIGAVSWQGIERGGVALSRGGASKQYSHTDPNEDAALCAEGAGGIVLAVADGHSGHAGAEHALERLLADHATGWTGAAPARETDWRDRLLCAVADANDAVRRAPRSERSRAPRTTLALAVLRPAEGLWVAASIGDSHVFQADPHGVTERVADERRRLRFLGRGAESAASLAGKLRVEVLPLARVRAVVLATDGLSEHGIGVADPAQAVERALCCAADASPHERAPQAARTLVEIALEAQRRQDAGDNVAVATAWLTP